MMANAFRPVNFPSPNPEPTRNDMTSPATPRSSAGAQLEQPRTVDDATTPTRASFHASMSSQKPLPSSPFPQAVQVPNSSSSPVGMNEREGSGQPANDDVEMDGSSVGQADAGSTGHEADILEEAGSDEDSPNADGSRSSKKKKSQRFYCTEFPPCNLSFTRSEHLARHIRYVGHCRIPVLLGRRCVANLDHCAANILARGHSSVTVRGAFPDWTIYGSTPRLYISTKTFLSIP